MTNPEFNEFVFDEDGNARYRIEVRDGVKYRVEILPEAKPPKNRSAKTRYHMDEVGKAGDLPMSRSRRLRLEHQRKRRGGSK